MSAKQLKLEPWKRLTRLYLLALVLIAFFTVLSQFLIQNSIKNILFDSKIVNLSGRQRFQSQSMVKIVLILTNPEIKLSSEEKEYYKMRLRNFLHVWDKNHYGLMNGHLPEYNYHAINSKEINDLFHAIHPRYLVLSRNFHKILDSSDFLPSNKIALARDSILKNEFIFLDTMDQIVYQYDNESKQKVEKIRRMEFYILIATFLVLFLEGIFIFWPAVKQIKESFLKILESEKQTKLLYEELEKAYNNLKNTELKLAENEKKRLEAELNLKKERSLALLMGQENERKRIAKDLHDGLGQSLSALKLYYDRLAKKYTLDGTDDDKELKKLINLTITEVRTITFNLMPFVLEDFGLVAALQMLCKDLSVSSGIEIDLKTNFKNLKRLGQEVEIGLYRISQEALNNAIKHAQAKKIEVNLWEEQDKLILTVADDGVGFVIPKKSKLLKNGLGLQNMKERASLIGGEFELISEPKFGTKVKIIIPLNTN
jgi:signal transduction histidine kinase